jgi:hypothetical protein
MFNLSPQKHLFAPKIIPDFPAPPTSFFNITDLWNCFCTMEYILTRNMSTATLPYPSNTKEKEMEIIRQINEWETCYAECFCDGADKNTLKRILIEIELLQKELEKEIVY